MIGSNPQTEHKPTKRQRLEFVSTFYLATLLPELIPGTSHWNHIADGLILGALPIASKIFKFGDHGNKIIAECAAKNRPLRKVYSIVNRHEMNGEYLGLKPVSSEFWASKGVQHKLVPMDDFSGNIQIEYLKKFIDDMEAEINAGGSIYIHCKAGKGRSFAFVACYLLTSTSLDVTDVLELMHSKRHQVSPSKSQLDLIEKFRAAYCPDKAPLNKNSRKFDPYHKGLKFYRSKPWVHAVIGGGVFFSLPVAIIVGIGSSVAQYVKAKLDNRVYKQIDNHCAIDKLTDAQIRAVKSGMESANSWKSWASHIIDSNAGRYYGSYRAGIRLAQENSKMCAEVDTRITIASKQKKA